MALTLALLVVFSFLLLVFNHKNKYSILFAIMSLALALITLTLIIEVQRISNYRIHRTYFFSWADVRLFFFINRRLSLPLSTVLIWQNIGYTIFQLANVALIFLFSKNLKHNIVRRLRHERLVAIGLVFFVMLYYVFNHPDMGFRIFMLQFHSNPSWGNFLLSVAYGVFIALQVLVFVCPLVPILFLIVWYKKGWLTIFTRQLIGLIFVVLAFNSLLFMFIMEPPLLKWELLLRFGFWRGLSEEIVVINNIHSLPIITFAILLFITYMLFRFQTTNFVEYYKEYAVRKKVRTLHENLRDVLHSEKNIIFNVKILAESALHDYGTAAGKEKLERLLHLSGSHLNSLAQSIDSIKDWKVNVVKRNFMDAIEAALDAYPIPPEVEVVTHYQDKPISCQYDLYHMTQVIINLIENAVDSLKGQSDGKIQISLDVSDYWIQFSIGDNGKGISKKEIRKICRPYYTTKSKQKNWGIGLNYVQRVVKAHHGYMLIKSEPNKWTKVELLFMCA